MINLTDKEFQTLVSFVHTKYGINLEKKRILIEGRMSNMLKERGFATFQQYMDVLFKDRSGAEVTTLLNKLTTNHTFFMREIEHFDYMKTQVLPLFEQSIKTREMRIWSAGCSSGQEPYTIAMALSEYFGMRKSQWKITIQATDISMNALEKAKKATYTLDELKDVPEAWRKKYFVDNKNGTHTLCDALRKDISFSTLNLMEPMSFAKPFDLIFCRNVMIYFDAPTKDKLINKFYDVTAMGGFLFIGHSEVINRETAKYTYIRPAIYQKRGATK